MENSDVRLMKATKNGAYGLGPEKRPAAEDVDDRDIEVMSAEQGRPNHIRPSCQAGPPIRNGDRTGTLGVQSLLQLFHDRTAAFLDI
jgi:hypothetical protein